ncbi:hypothetical protein ACIBSV_47090 [Embleya sp. NPDC050154]|uniref:hypothetical protein n=1 Tax=Embleya sp. NPDC050154 TaxID=3363988 RepID=UPI0037A1AD8A
MIRLITRRRLQRLHHAISGGEYAELRLAKQIDELKWERADLRAANAGLLQHTRQLAAERDQARAIAVDLEQQLAAASEATL